MMGVFALILIFAYTAAGAFAGVAILWAARKWQPDLAKYADDNADKGLILICSVFGPFALLAAAIVIATIYIEREA